MLPLTSGELADLRDALLTAIDSVHERVELWKGSGREEGFESEEEDYRRLLRRVEEMDGGAESGVPAMIRKRVGNMKKTIRRFIHSLRGGRATLLFAMDGHWEYGGLMCAAMVERIHRLEFGGDERLSLTITTARLPRRMIVLRSRYRTGLAAALRPSAMAEEKSRPAWLMSLALCAMALWRLNRGRGADDGPRVHASLTEVGRLMPGWDEAARERAVELYNDNRLRDCISQAMAAADGEVVAMGGNGTRVSVNVLQAGWGEKEDE